MNKRHIYVGTGLLLLPILVVGAFILIVRIQAIFRYDPAYFTPAYQERYASPGAAAIAIEEGLHNEDPSIYAELTGLRRQIHPPDANPNARLMMLWEVTDEDYYQYLFFDVVTYHRLMFNVKQVDGRWVMVPQDTFYFLDSGEWQLFFTPAVTIYWSLLVVILVGAGIFKLAARFRRQIYAHPGESERDRGKHDRIDH